jgi:hypothetical protein
MCLRTSADQISKLGHYITDDLVSPKLQTEKGTFVIVSLIYLLETTSMRDLSYLFFFIKNTIVHPPKNCLNENKKKCAKC